MLKQQLHLHFGFDSFLKGQKDVIQNILDGQSVAAIFPTGAGKSLCYQLPAMMLPGMTLVVSPLLSLMKDQLDFLLLDERSTRFFTGKQCPCRAFGFNPSKKRI